MHSIGHDGVRQDDFVEVEPAHERIRREKHERDQDRWSGTRWTHEQQAIYHYEKAIKEEQVKELEEKLEKAKLKAQALASGRVNSGVFGNYSPTGPPKVLKPHPPKAGRNKSNSDAYI